MGKDRRMKKSIISLIILVLIIFTNNNTYASMADYTDEDAKNETQRMIQEHKENFDSTKSDNNYFRIECINVYLNFPQNSQGIHPIHICN